MKPQLDALPVRQRLRSAVQLRMQMIHPYMATWPQAVAVMAHPRNAPSALSIAAAMVNDIWYAVGDNSTDSSWYSKRAALAAVFATTEAFMLTDTSKDYIDTWSQLERR